MAARATGKTRAHRTLLAGTVRAVARLGLENTTTGAICAECRQNVTSIYRRYRTKEELLADAFAAVDLELLSVALENISVLEFESADRESRWHVLFTRCWDYLISSPDDLLFYIRYYFSESFRLYAADEHTRRYEALIGRMEGYFPKTDTRMLLRHILTTLLCEAQRQILDGKADPTIAGEQCFRLVYCVVRAFGEG